jgi:hypothetical protein
LVIVITSTGHSHLIRAASNFSATFHCQDVTVRYESFMNYDLPPPRRYPYFDAVVGFVWSDGPVSYASGRWLLVGFKGDDPDKKEYPGPPGWWLGMALKTPTA